MAYTSMSVAQSGHDEGQVWSTHIPQVGMSVLNVVHQVLWSGVLIAAGEAGECPQLFRVRLLDVGLEGAIQE